MICVYKLSSLIKMNNKARTSRTNGLTNYVRPAAGAPHAAKSKVLCGPV